MCVCGRQLQSFRDKMAGTFDVAVRRPPHAAAAAIIVSIFHGKV
jgi:hypothetical protein